MLWLFGARSEPVPASPPPDPTAILRRARRLRFRVRPEAVAALVGLYHGARPGTGLTFAELRPYEPGDDVRHLDWKVTARQQRPYVRRYVEERALTLWLLLDVSGSMRFGPEGRTKADRAAQAAALLAAAAIHNADRVGLTLVSDRIEAELPPAGSPRQLARLLRMLVTTPVNSSRSALLAGVRAPRRRARRGLIVVLSDFLDIEPARAWKELARRHDLIALRLVEPRELALPRSRLLALADAESGSRLLVDAGSRRVRAAYARASRERQAAFRTWCAEVGATGHDLATELDPILPLLRIFHGRAVRRGHR